MSTFEELVKAAKAKGYQLDEEKVRLKEDEPLLKSGFGFPLPAEVREYFLRYGGRDASVTTEAFRQLIPWCEIWPLEFNVEVAKRLDPVLRSAKHGKHFVKDVVVPFMWSANDWVSFCQTPAGGIGITLKRGGYDVPSEIWPSAEAFFEFHAQCWREGIYRYVRPEDTVDYDSEKLHDLQLKSENAGACVIVMG